MLYVCITFVYHQCRNISNDVLQNHGRKIVLLLIKDNGFFLGSSIDTRILIIFDYIL